MARARCLYCGAELPRETVEAAAAARAEALGEGPSAAPGTPETEALRALVVLDLEGTAPEAVASALGLTAFEAAQRVRRRGVQLHRTLPEAEAAREAARLQDAGLTATVLPEREVKEGQRPQVATGGGFDGTALTVTLQEGSTRVAPSDVLLVVQGPIAREYPPSPDIRRVRMATLDPGYRFHLHRLGTRAPLELDPAEFHFASPPGSGSSFMEIAAWVEVLGAGAEVDDTFRREPVALSPAEPPAGLVAALGRPRPARAEAAGREEAPWALDNLLQFRAFSAWRGALARRRARSPA